MTPDALSIIESAYRVESSDAEWMNDILAAARPSLDAGLGLTGYFVDVRGSRFRVWGHRCVGRDPEADRRNLLHWLRTTPRALQRHSHMVRPSGLVSELQPPEGWRPKAHRGHDGDMDELLVRSGFPEVFGISALDPSGQGCAISAPRPRGSAVPDRQVWDRVAIHLAAALRLRRRLAEKNDASTSAEAVLAPNGKVVHAEGSATEASAQDALRAAAIRIDAARTARGRRDLRRATEVWQGLLSGRWSVVDRFDRDGRRYYVAWRNETDAPEASLTPGEAAVVAALGLGHSNKVIAYELGISESTVARRLASATVKLGVRSRADLVRLGRATT